MLPTLGRLNVFVLGFLARHLYIYIYRDIGWPARDSDMDSIEKSLFGAIRIHRAHSIAIELTEQAKTMPDMAMPRSSSPQEAMSSQSEPPNRIISEAKYREMTQLKKVRPVNRKNQALQDNRHFV